MNKLKAFQNAEFGEVRTIEENGRVLFCGSDIARALRYGEPHKAVSRHCRAGDGMKRPVIDTMGRTQSAVFIPEGDVYRLIAHSKLPSAERFERWVFDEVLPTIRQTGGYIPSADGESDDQILARALIIAQRTIERKDALLREQAPKVVFADAVSASESSILVGELAKMIKQNGVDTGQNRLFADFRKNGYLISRKGSDYNMPTQRAMEMGLFEIKETAITHADGHVTISKTPKVTGKGQQYFINLYLEERA